MNAIPVPAGTRTAQETRSAVDERATALVRARYERIAPVYDLMQLGVERFSRSWRAKLWRLILLEHMRASSRFAGTLLDAMNPLAVRLLGANINRRTMSTINAAGLRIESVEHLALGGIVKLIVARTPQSAPGSPRSADVDPPQA